MASSMVYQDLVTLQVDDDDDSLLASLCSVVVSYRFLLTRDRFPGA